MNFAAAVYPRLSSFEIPDHQMAKSLGDRLGAFNRCDFQSTFIDLGRSANEAAPYGSHGGPFL